MFALLSGAISLPERQSYVFLVFRLIGKGMCRRFSDKGAWRCRLYTGGGGSAWKPQTIAGRPNSTKKPYRNTAERPQNTAETPQTTTGHTASLIKVTNSQGLKTETWGTPTFNDLPTLLSSVGKQIWQDAQNKPRRRGGGWGVTQFWEVLYPWCSCRNWCHMKNQ